MNIQKSFSFPNHQNINSHLHPFELEGTPLSGIPAHITLSFLGNIQIIEMLTHGKKVSYKKGVPEKHQAKKVAAIAAMYGVHQIGEDAIRMDILSVLSLKIEFFLNNQQIFISTSKKPKLSLREKNIDILLEAPSIINWEIRNSLIDEKELMEIAKVFKLSGLQKMPAIQDCPNLLHLIKQKAPPLEQCEEYTQLVIKWFKDSTSHGNIFDSYELSLALEPFSNIFIISFGKLGFRFFKMDPKIIALAGEETIKGKFEFSDAEIRVFREIKRQMDLFDQNYIEIKKSEFIVNHRELQNLSLKEIEENDFKEYEKGLVSNLRYKHPQCLDCFLLPRLDKKDVLRFALNFPKTS